MIATFTDRSDAEAYITVCYTKTTDEGNDNTTNNR